MLIFFYLQGKTYTFDNILKPNVTQEQVYNTSAKDIVVGKLKDINYRILLDLYFFNLQIDPFIF